MTVARPPLAVIVGPTASGKTAAALRLAGHLGAEIISADSQQVYRHMDIGTGKLAVTERQSIPHHLIDVIDPDEDMTAARFLDLADRAIAAAHARGRAVVVAGGTGLYVRVLLYGLFDAPPADPALRERLHAEAEAAGTEHLWQRLADLDPPSAARIERRDLRRIVRALEVQALTGVAMSEHQARHDFRTLPMRYDAVLLGLAPPRDDLYRHIDARVDAMIAAGLVDEVSALRRAGYGPWNRSQKAIGYAEIHDHLDGRLDLARAVELIKRNSRRYARRQLSWYRGDRQVRWHASAEDIDLGSVERYLRSESPDINRNPGLG